MPRSNVPAPTVHALARVTLAVSSVLFLVSLAVVLARPTTTTANVQPALELVPASGDSSTVFGIRFNDPTDQFCPGDANAGYSWSSFLAPMDIDIDAVTWGAAVPGFPDFESWLVESWAPVLSTVGGSSVVGIAPGLNDGFVAPPVDMTFSSVQRYRTLPAGEYQIGVACIKADGAVFTTRASWSTTITLTDQQGAGANEFVYETVVQPTTTTSTSTSTTLAVTLPTTTTTVAEGTTTTTDAASSTTTTTDAASSTTTTTDASMPTSTSVPPSTTPPTSVQIPPSDPDGCPSGAEPGCLGRNVALPLTESAVVAVGRGDFDQLRITVNQTAALTRQAVSIEWEGATPTRTTSGGSNYYDNYLQIFQCWGDPETGDDGSFDDNPGPPPEQCIQGAQRGKVNPPDLGVGSLVADRRIALPGYTDYDPDAGFVEPVTQQVWRPFRAVDGTTVDFMIDPLYRPTVGGVYWRNPYFSVNTTNEIVIGRTFPDGTGTAQFEVLTGVESSGLGCGQRVQPDGDGAVKAPQCWLVVVPRGDAADENVGGFPAWLDRPEQYGVQTSPVSDAAWANRIAIPLEFNPVDSDCSIESLERRVSGTELLVPAVASWQPVLCATSDLPPYSYAPVSDSTARLQLANPSAGSPGMIVASRPLDETQILDDNPIVYAPLAASGVAVGFAFERPSFGPGVGLPEYQAIQGSRVQELNLTPRLMAKLLTQSYRETQYQGRVPDGYEWLEQNPIDLRDDPDFLQFNPEFELMGASYRRQTAGLLVPQSNSDYARLVWEWILADDEASAWLDGEPDGWGMQVNPVYSTDPEINPNGLAFGDPAPNLFPKNDPNCYQPPEEIWGTPPALCGTDLLPYVRSLVEAAQSTARGTDRAKVAVDPFASDPLGYWQRVDRQVSGRQSMISLTDTPSATLSGIQMARLSRAGDNAGPGDRIFVAPTTSTMQAAIDAMEPRSDSGVLEPVFDLPESAYPLTTLSFAAVAPLALDDDAREEYAAFIRYAAGPGQQPGFELGRLPAGYAPLTTELVAQAEAAAVDVEELQESTTTTTTSAATTTTTAATTTTVPASSGGGGFPSVGGSGFPSVGGSGFPSVGGSGFPSGGGGGLPSSGGSSGGSGGGSPVAAGPSGGESSGGVQSPASSTPPSGSSVQASDPAGETGNGTIDAAPPTTRSAPPSGTAPQVDRPATPAATMGPSRFAVPSLFGLIMLASLAVLEITKRPRRSAAPGTGG